MSTLPAVASKDRLTDFKDKAWDMLGTFGIKYLSFGYGARGVIRKAAFALVFAPSLALAQSVTVAALGDSLTQGYGLPEVDGLVPNLEKWVQDQGVEADFINAGVSGDTTAGGLSRVDWTLGNDVDAMIVALGGNDILRGLPPENARENIRGILEIAAERDVPVLLVGLRAPSNFGADYKAEFDAIYPELAQEFNVLYHPGFIDAFGEEGTPLSEVLQYFQADNIHPNAEGVDLIVAEIGPTVLDLISQIPAAE